MDRLGLVITTRLGFRFSGRDLLTPAQVDERIQILQHTSMRSIAALAEFDPTWVLQTDPDLEGHVQQRIDDGSITAPTGCRMHLVTRRGAEFSSSAIDELGDLPDHFLCARLDSDDYYLPEAVGWALRQTHLRVSTLVDFHRGYLVDLAQGDVQHHSYVSQGPFYGIVTDRSDPLPSIGHHESARKGHEWVSVEQRSWLQTVHSSNVMTTFASDSFTQRVRSMRREVIRNGATRPRRQSFSRFRDLVPPPRRTRERLAKMVEEHGPDRT